MSKLNFDELRVDKSADVPAYRQLIEKFAILIRRGRIGPGDKLPTERELASRLGIARGTIKRAYEEMRLNGIVEVTQGRGTFVSRQDAAAGGRKEEALALINGLLTRLEAMRFSFPEIRNLIDLIIFEREERRENLNILAVDCNPEALSIYQKQLGFISSLRISTMLLDDLLSSGAPQKRVADFELILVTSNHYRQLVKALPDLKEKIVEVAVAPSQSSIIDLVAIRPPQRVGIICQSRKFLEIIQDKLSELNITAGTIGHILVDQNDAGELAEFLENKDVLIVPAGMTGWRGWKDSSAIQAFAERGGKVLTFDYQIERGSLLHIQERLRDLMDKLGGGKAAE